MATDEIGIVNLALTAIGEEPLTETGDVADITATNKVERAVKAQYPTQRDIILRTHPWNEATDRSALARDDTPVWGFAFRFALPADFLRMLRIEFPKSHWRREGNFILSDDTDLNIVYIKRLTDVTLMGPMLQEVIAAKLAVELALVIPQNESLFGTLYQTFERKLSEARYQDSQEGPIEVIQGETWIDAHDGRGDPFFGSSRFRRIESGTQ